MDLLAEMSGVKVGRTTLNSSSLKPKIAVCISGDSAIEYAMIAKQQKADLIEVRCDLFERNDPEFIVETLKDLKVITDIPILATMRDYWVSNNGEKFQYKGTKTDRLQIFKKIMPHIDMVDIELNTTIRDTVLDEARKYDKPAIVSYHDFQKTESLEKLKKIVDEAYNTSGNIIKIATMANSKEDVVTALRLLLSYTEDKVRSSKKPIIVISMGELGKISRLSFPLFGSCLTYAHLDASVYQAPGQMDINDVRLVTGT